MIKEPSEYSLAAAELAIKTTRLNMTSTTKALDACPQVDSEGASDCPYAEGIYQKKEDRAWFLRQSLKELYVLSQGAAAVIEGLSEKQRRADGDSEEYEGFALMIGRHKRMKAALDHTAKEGHEVLREAKAKSFPGMKYTPPSLPFE